MVESGLDDLGHLVTFYVDGSSTSHPQIKLFGCDPDIIQETMCSLECACGVQRFHSQEVERYNRAWDQLCLVWDPATNRKNEIHGNV